MTVSKTRLLTVGAIFCALALSLTLRAEESYKRFTVRNWSYNDGTEATGKLISVVGSKVTLRLDGKGTVQVPLEKLSVKDLNWIYEYHKRKKQLNFLPPEYRKPQVVTAKPQPAPEPTTPTKPQPENEPAKLQQSEKSMPAQPAAEESYAPFTERQWTLKDGKTFRSKFLSLLQRNVLLQSTGAPAQQVPMDQLSQKDLDWVIEYHRRNKQEAFLPKEYQGAGTTPPAEKPLSGVPPVKPMKPGKSKLRIVVTDPEKAKNNPLVAAMEKKTEMQEKQPEEMREPEKAKVEAKAEEPSGVVKANTTIDPELVAALYESRVWTDKKGQKSQARFHAINGREAMFVGPGLGFIRVHLGTLSEDDLQLLRDALKMHGRMAELPFVYREDLDPDLATMKLKQILRVNNHRQWTDLSGNKVGASYVKMEDGIVTLLITATGTPQEFPYQNFSAEDQEFVQERLKKETPGNFFPDDTAVADLALTPEEQKEEFRIWTDRKNRKIKGKFVKLAFGKSVAVINTGEKEELFITEFFSDPDLSLIKPRQKKEQQQSNQLASNDRGRSPFAGMMNPGQAGRSPFSGPATRGNQPGIQMNEWSFDCPLCNKRFTANTPFAEQCPHCGLKQNESVYQCGRCSRKFRSSEGNGLTAPCPHCNQNRQNPVAARNAANRNLARSGLNQSNSSKSAYESGYESGHRIGSMMRENSWVIFSVLFVGMVIFFMVKVLG